MSGFSQRSGRAEEGHGHSPALTHLLYDWQLNLSVYVEECVVRKHVLENTKYPSSSLSLDIN